MHKRQAGLSALSIILLVSLFGEGCNKPGSESTSAPVPETQAKQSGSDNATVARIHWLGKKRIAAGTNATYFMTLWNMSESAELETQTLNRLATAPWRLMLGQGSGTNIEAPIAASPLLRPLLDDLIQEESYLEVRGGSNQPGALVLAIHLDRGRTALWDSNLAVVCESLIAGHRAPRNGGGWAIDGQGMLSSAELSHAGDWTVFSLASKGKGFASSVTGRIQHEQTPAANSGTNFWFEADVDCVETCHALGVKSGLPEGFPHVSLNMIGDGENVRTRAEFVFSQALPIVKDSWQIPTNLVRDPLSSFTAVRGVKSLLQSFKPWRENQTNQVPNQVYLWAQSVTPFTSFMALPLEDCSNQVHQIGTFLIDQGNPWLSTNGMGKMERVPKTQGVAWMGVPFMAPFFQAATGSDTNFAIGGLFPNAGTNHAPAEMFGEVLSDGNLVCYDWELVGTRIQQWVDIAQILRISLRKPQLPTGSASMKWLLAIAPKLGNSVRVVKLSDEHTLSVESKSGAVLTGVEFHLLTDWLESSEFPANLHTLEAKAARKSLTATTNRVPGEQKR